jgi:cytochrome c
VKKENPLQVMLRTMLACMAAVGLWGAAEPASASQELVLKKNCGACHYVDKRKYGPSFQQVAAKYADQKNAVDVLAKKIRRGGTGVWGQDVMPPQPQVSAAEAKAIATYVLSLK